LELIELKSSGVRIVRVLSLFVVALSFMSCGGNSTPEPTATPVPTPTPVNVETLLRDAGAATAALDTFHFLLEHNTGGTPLAPNLTVTEAKGDVVNPDGISTEFAGTLGAFAVRSSLITLGDESYMTNPLTGAWESVPKEVSPLGFFDPQSGIGAMMTQVQNPTLLSSGKDEIRVGGALPVEALKSLLGDAAQGTTVDSELTIDARTLFLTEAILRGRVTATEPDGVVRTITLSKFNQPLSIVAPN
jgi:lipoprotein LprG